MLVWRLGGTLHTTGMMSLEQIVALNAKIAAEARQAGTEPYVPRCADEVDDYPPFPFPNLGQVPTGYEVTDRFFVDKTGLGRSSEPALTIEQFRTLLYDHITDHPDHAFAIVEEGPFQVVVGALRRVREDVEHILGDGSHPDV